MANPAPKRIAFLGVDSLAGFENLKWWSFGKSAIRRPHAAEEAPIVVDVFGVGRRREPRVLAGPNKEEELAEGQPTWMHLPPAYFDRVAASRTITGVVCSGRGSKDPQVVIDALKAGKAVFVESVEHFSEEQLRQVAQLAGAEGPPVFMTGLYQRFDAQLAEVAEGGAENRVGRPLLYQAHASTLDDSLFDLGMQHVDAVRFLLKSEPVEVYASGNDVQLSRCEVLALTLKLANGVVAVLALDRSGTSARECLLLVGDQSRAEFEADLLGAPSLSAKVLRLQKAGVNHFVQSVLEGEAPRLALSDVLRARAVMLTAAESLRTGAAVAVPPGDGLAAPVAAGAGAPSTWLGQVASAVAHTGPKATPRRLDLSAEDSAKADTPPKEHPTKTSPLGARTPDSPELLPFSAAGAAAAGGGGAAAKPDQA